MGKTMTKERRIKSLEEQIHKFSSNLKIAERLKIKLRTYKNSKEKKK
jgi:hypothetical protein